MKNLKKLVTIGVSLAMAASLFTGCSYDGNTLSNALSRTKEISTYESKTELGLRFSAENLSEDEQQSLGQLASMINGSKMTIDSKINQSGNGTIGKIQSDISMNVSNIPQDMAIWADVNTADGNNEIKEIIKVPTAQSKELDGKQYVVLDNSQMNGTGSANADLVKTSQEMQKELGQLISTSLTSFNPSFKFVSNKGYAYVDLPDGKKSVRIFEVKLNDQNLKEMVKYISNNLIYNKEARGLLEDYLITITKMSALKEEDVEAQQAEIEKSFSDFEKGLPDFTNNMNKVLDSFDSVPIVGEKGIVIDYAIDSNGYIVDEKGNIDLVFDAPKFMSIVQELSGTNTQNKLTGTYKLGIDFNTSNFNLNNQSVKVTMPELNSENSVQFQDLIDKNKVK